MRHLLALIALIWLSTGMVVGVAVHAAEPADEAALVEADGWLHSAGDHDEVPADNHSDYPHHHLSCSGHDVGAGAAKIGGADWLRDNRLFDGRYAMSVAEAPPGTDLRPPIS